MAIVFTVDRSRSGSQNESDLREYDVTYIAVTDDPGYGPIYVRQQLAIQIGWAPGILSNYSTGGAHPEFDTAAQVLSINVTEVNTDGMQWIVAVHFAVFNPDTMAKSPLLLPPGLSVEGQVFQEPIDVDISGNPLVNTAGDPYDPGILVDKQRLAIRIQQNLQSFPSFSFAYVDYLNLNTFCGLSAKTVKLAPPQVTRSYHPACGRYYDCAFSFDYNPNAWQASPLNQGFRQLVSGVQVAITDKNGQPISSPLPLDASGVVLAIPATSGDIITNHYDVYKTVDFNTLFSFGVIP
jgi:hypothetical protein